METGDEVEIRILKERRTRGGVREFLVRWKGYDESEDEWLKEYDMPHALEAIQEFQEKRKDARETSTWQEARLVQRGWRVLCLAGRGLQYCTLANCSKPSRVAGMPQWVASALNARGTVVDVAKIKRLPYARDVQAIYRQSPLALFTSFTVIVAPPCDLQALTLQYDSNFVSYETSYEAASVASQELKPSGPQSIDLITARFFLGQITVTTIQSTVFDRKLADPQRGRVCGPDYRYIDKRANRTLIVLDAVALYLSTDQSGGRVVSFYRSTNSTLFLAKNGASIPEDEEASARLLIELDKATTLPHFFPFLSQAEVLLKIARMSRNPHLTHRMAPVILRRVHIFFRSFFPSRISQVRNIFQLEIYRLEATG
ncbi:hypothetical protein E4T56_gene11553 [Termitomyces sp. T112]|nr:hypothetical protein E4T56_gene11553 [Termitomyces sp. T112]